MPNQHPAILRNHAPTLRTLKAHRDTRTGTHQTIGAGSMRVRAESLASTGVSFVPARHSPRLVSAHRDHQKPSGDRCGRACRRFKAQRARPPGAALVTS